MIKSTSLCFSISSVWKFVIKKDISYPWGPGVSLKEKQTGSGPANLDGLPPEDEEGLGTLCEESGELVDQDVLNLVGLLDLDADSYAVDAGLNEHALVLVAGNCQRRQQDLGRCPSLDLGDIVALGGLRCEVGEAEGGSQATPDSLEVGAE
jgi:hypothetical protein